MGDVQHLGEGHLAVVRERSAGGDEDDITRGHVDGLAAHLECEQALDDLKGRVARERRAAADTRRRCRRRIVAEDAHGGLVAQLLGHDDGRDGEVVGGLGTRDQGLDDLVEAGLVVQVLDAVVLGHKVWGLGVGSEFVDVVADVPAGAGVGGRVGPVDEGAGGDVVELGVDVEGRQGGDDRAVGGAALGVVIVRVGHGVRAVRRGGVVGVGEGVEEILESTWLDDAHHVGIAIFILARGHSSR